MIPQCSWCGDGMRARALADTASEKSRERAGKTSVCRPANGLASWTRAQATAILLMPSRRVDPKPPMKLPQVHSIHGIVLPGTSSRPRRTPGTSPAPRRQVCPRPQRCPKSSTKALRLGHPAHNTGMRPIQESKNKNTPKIATFLRLRIAAGRQNTDEARKNGKLDARRPISTSQRTEGSPQSQKSCTEIGILVFARRVVAAEHTLRKTRAPPKPIGPSSITGPCDINQGRHSRPRLPQRPRARQTELTPGKDRALVRLNSPWQNPALIRLKMQHPKRNDGQNKRNSRKLLKASSLQPPGGRT